MVSLGNDGRAGKRRGRTTKSLTVVATGCFCMGAILVCCVLFELSQSELVYFVKLQEKSRWRRRIETPNDCDDPNPYDGVTFTTRRSRIVKAIIPCPLYVRLQLCL